MTSSAPFAHIGSPRGSVGHANVGLGHHREECESVEETTDELRTLLQNALKQHVVLPRAAPGAAAAIAQRTNGVWVTAEAAAGTMDVFGPQEVTPDTWYDLASVTKSVAAVSVARAVDQGLLEWDAPLESYLPEVRGTFAAGASVSNLLSHRAGLAAHIAVYAAPAEALPKLADARHYSSLPAAGAGHPPVYSDVGYILLGKALERVTQQPLDDWFSLCLTPPLAQGLCSARQLQARGVPMGAIAPTEVVPYRGGLVRGHVHDDNAWALSETNTSGHAGLFGTAAGVLDFGMTLLDCVAGRCSLLSPESLDVLLKQRQDGVLRAGFDGKSPSNSSAGTELGSRTFGHLGFTGTSYWCDPDTETVIVLLCNRVCPRRDNAELKRRRPLVHDELTRLARSL